MASTPTSRILTSRSYCEALRRHYVNCWGSEPEPLVFQEGSADELPSEFRVLRFAPNERRKMWTYSTVCMSQRQNDEVVELLVVTSHYHRTGEWLGLGHTVNFGRPWWTGSACDHGLISLPYLDGPKLEWLELGAVKVRFLWLVPVTKTEIEFKKAKGLSALERKFEKTNFNYLDPQRPSVV